MQVGIKTTVAVNKRILQLAIPNIISNITVPLLGVVDLTLAGHLESEIYIGAISLGSVIYNFIFWGFAFLRMSTSGFTSQAYGRRNLPESVAVLSRSVFVAVLAGVFIIAIQKPISVISFALIGGTQNVEELAAQYFHICIWAAPAALFLYSTSGWFIGMQNSRFPMFVSILVNLTNIVASIVFVKYLGMKSDGIAFGSVVAQYTGMVFSIILISKYYKKLFKYWQYELMTKVGALKSFVRVNTDIFIRMICVIFVFTFFTSKSAAQDNTTLAVNALLLQFLMIYSYLIDGFAYAAEALTGRYIGAGNSNSLKKVVKLLFVWGFFIGLVFSVLYYFGANSFLNLLTNNQEIIAASKQYVPWVYLIPIVSTASFVWDGIYIGATASKSMRNTMIIATIGVFVPTYLIASHYVQNHGLWLAMMLFLSSRGVYQTIIAKKAIPQLMN